MSKEFNVDACTLQEAMDYAVSKMVEQGGACEDFEGCVYGDEEGRHCGVGWLLDHNNKELMEYREDVESLCLLYPEYVPTIIKENVNAFKYLQVFHDAITRDIAEACRDYLKNDFNIDTSGKHWHNWIQMKPVETKLE